MNDLILRNFSYDPSASMFQFMNSIFPKIDLVENDKMLMVKADVPGFTPDCIDIRIEGSYLILRGECRQERQEASGQYHIQERDHSSFSRAVPLPAEINPNAAMTEFDQGILTITLPKRERAASKRISIIRANAARSLIAFAKGR